MEGELTEDEIKKEMGVYDVALITFYKSHQRLKNILVF